MRKLILILVMACFALVSTKGQAPQKINYQALIRDANNSPLIEKPVSMRFSILYKTVTGVVKYSETQTVNTDKNGVVSLKIGEGTPLIGTMNAVDWNDGPYFLKIELKYLTPDYLLMGTSEMASTPFALFANSTPPVSSLPKLSIASPATTGGEESLFEVKNKDGKTVFAVYNEGVRVYTPTTATSTKGGFAVASFPSVTTGKTKEYLRVTADSVRIYIDTLSSKGTKGGFAIGTMTEAKAKNLEFMRVSDDSVRIYVSPKSSKGTTKGGFAIGGFNEAKGTTDNFLKLTPKNYFIGHNSGKNTTTGLYNSFLGYMAGYMNTTGSSNTFFGDSTGLNNTTGSWNVFIGKEAGYSNQTSVSNVYIGNGAGKMAKETATSSASYNVALGTLAGYNNNGMANVFVGQQAGEYNKLGSWNVMLGTLAGDSSDVDTSNVVIGAYAGYLNKANYNVLVGTRSGKNTTSGDKNVMVGTDAGYYNTTGRRNIFLGNLTGTLNTTGEYNLFAGSQAGYSNKTGGYNVYLGTNAGMNATGSSNTAIGNAAGKYLTSDYNTMVGFQAGYNSSSGMGNTFLGGSAGHDNTTGDYNTAIGPDAGHLNSTGNYNTSLGSGAGYNNYSGSNNVFIGKWAGYYETGSDKLYIDNTNHYSSTAFMYGDFILDQLRINARVGINSAPSLSYNLYIVGSGYASGNWWTLSDLRLKQNVKSIEGDGTVAKIKDLDVIKYDLKNQAAKGDTIVYSKEIGVIAQEIEKSFPELVRTDNNGFKAVNYDGLTAVLLQAIKDQQKQIDSLRNEVKLLKTGK